MSSAPSTTLVLLAFEEQLVLVRRLVLPAVQRRARTLGADEDDLVQDVLLRILEAQRRPGSRYDPARGMSLSSYLYLVGRSAAHNSLRKLERWRREVATDEIVVEASDTTDDAGALDRVLGALDLDEEKEMALHLAAGCTVAEASRRMQLDAKVGAELACRVRALLLALRDD